MTPTKLIRNQSILTLSGPTRIGKDTILNYLKQMFNYEIITTYTTRSPRSNEEEGRDYHFLEVPRFQRLINEGFFLEWDFTIGNYYGLARDSFINLKRPLALHLLSKIALRLMINQKKISITPIFLCPLSTTFIEQRINSLYRDDIERQRRLEHLNEEMTHCALFNNIVYVSEISSLEEVVMQIRNIHIQTL